MPSWRFQEGKGWTVAKYLLGYERMNTGRIGASKRELEKVKEFSKNIADSRFRDRLHGRCGHRPKGGDPGHPRGVRGCQPHA